EHADVRGAVLLGHEDAGHAPLGEALEDHVPPESLIRRGRGDGGSSLAHAVIRRPVHDTSPTTVSGPPGCAPGSPRSRILRQRSRPLSRALHATGSSGQPGGIIVRSRFFPHPTGSRAWVRSPRRSATARSGPGSAGAPASWS